ncbi:unnamed protein product [Paramecium primaurelia]|uniref:Uncharacterized protein n=1 Tax=Paramecium primaurelia TaxID=5886 RepID=A0A8S1KIR9_PARPR|nr:unnamed protein product [Paramecium primaurelia]
MKKISSIVDYPPFEFNGKRIPITALICNEPLMQKEKKQNSNINIYTNQYGKNKNRSKSTPPSLRELLTDTYIITLTERTLPAKKISILLPFKNAVEKIRSKNREIINRRKSCYGSLFGQNQQKQMTNFPTTIEMHKKINGKEFALSSFAELLKKNQRKSTKRPSLARKLSKQMSLVGKVYKSNFKNMIIWKDLLLVKPQENLRLFYLKRRIQQLKQRKNISKDKNQNCFIL